MDSGESVFAGSFKERTVQSVDGLTLYVRDYPAAPPTTGLPVVLLHGLTRNSRDYETLAPRIAALGRRVIVPDTRGRGRSEYDPDPAHYVPAIYAQDVITICDALEIPRAVFIGTSMGGIITMLLSALAPERIAAAVLNDIGPRVGAAGVARIASYVGRGQPVENWAAAAEAVRATNGVAFPERLDDDAFWLAFARRTWRQRDDGMIELDYDPSIALAFTDPETSPPVDMTPLFEALSKRPVLVVRGALSDLLLPETIDYMRELKPDLETLELASIGHAPTLDEPEAWDAILDFLARAP